MLADKNYCGKPMHDIDADQVNGRPRIAIGMDVASVNHGAQCYQDVSKASKSREFNIEFPLSNPNLRGNRASPYISRRVGTRGSGAHRLPRRRSMDGVSWRTERWTEAVSRQEAP